MAAPPTAAPRDTDIAIVGLSVRFPGAPDHRVFWANLRDGVESIRALSKDELLAAGASSRDLENPHYVRAAAVLDGLADFDPEFFGLSPKEGAIMDPQHRHFLERCWEALEDAGHPPERFGGAIGVFAGCGMGAYFAFNLLSNPDLVRTVGLFLLRHTGNDKDFLATRASYCFDLKGPSVNIQTACSTSLVAAHVACQSLLAGECDMALAGGATIELPHGRGYVYEEGEILSPDGHCRSFDARSKGTVFGSGSGVVVLRRLADALADGDHVYAVIRGSAVNNDGAGKAGYLAPSVDGQATAIAEAIAIAGIEADELSYVECHGTGTPIGDPIEVAALTQAFRATSEGTGYCGIGSVKSNIGHLDTAAGVASLAKVALSLQHGAIPPSLHFERPNPSIEFETSPFFVNAKLAPWPADKPRVAGVNSLGVGGTNAFMIVEAAPAARPAPKRARANQLLVLSARNKRALDGACTRLASHLREHPSIALADVAYTLAIGRKAFGVRRVLAASETNEAIALLEGGDPRRVHTHSARESAPSVAFLLPGGGAQYVGMGVDLYSSEPIFREHVDRGLRLLEGKLDRDLRALWFAPPEARAAAAEELERPSIQLPAIFILEYALAQLWMAWGVTPKALLGHSMGENTAACLAGVMSFEDCLGLVTLRGKLFERVPEGGMLSVPLARETIEPLLGPELDLGVVNAPELCVVSGPRVALDAFARQLEQRQVDVQRIAISIAAHSAMLTPILAEFGAYLRSIKLMPPRVPFLSNRTGTWITSEQATDPQYWVDHLRGTVNFSRCARTLLEGGDWAFLEVGPGRTLSSLVKQQPAYRPELASIPSLRHPDEHVPDDLYFLAAYGRLWSAGLELDPKLLWPEGQRRRVPLPTYAFQRQRYWIEPGAGRVEHEEPDLAPPRLDDIGAWGYEPTWEASAAQPVADRARHTWLVFMDTAGVGAELARRLRADTHEVIEVHEADAYQRVNYTRYALSPEHGREGYDTLVRDLVAGGKVPDRIVHLWLATADESFRPGSSFFHRNLERGFYSLLFLAQALGSEGVKGPLHWTVVGNGVQRVGAEGLAYPEKALALGPARVIPREFPGYSSAFVDIELPLPGSRRFGNKRALAQAVAGAAERLMPELSAAPSNTTVALREVQRFVRTYRARPLTAPAAHTALRAGGVYLVTGGMGGIGLQLARHLAREHRAKLVLVGRTPLPPREDWASFVRVQGLEHPTSVRITALRELEEAGAEVLAVSADVADIVGMEEAVELAEARFGRIDGVFHTAGVLRDDLVLAKSQAAAEDVFAPKVHGTQVLDALFAERELPLLVLFSSTSTATAPAGQVDYVAANAYLDAYAEQHAGREDRRVLAIEWGIWSEIGMAATAGKKLGRGADDAARETRRPTRHPLLDARVQRGDAAPWFETTLATSSHWVLDEHRTLDGHALVPGTAYFELARAALQELGEERAFEVRDLFFFRPLTVPDDEDCAVRVLLERAEDGYAFEVRTQRTLEDGRTGWERNVQAKLVLHTLAAPKPLDLTELDRRCGLSATADDPAGARTGQERFLRFGPRWRVLRQHAYGQGEALARLVLPDTFASDTEQYRLHPALLDIATGFAMELIEGYGTSDDLWVPVAYRSVKVYAALGRDIRSWVRGRPGNRADKDFASFDVTLTDPEGRVLVEVSEFSIKRIANSGAFAIARPPAASDLVLDGPHGPGARKLSPGELTFQALLERGIRAEEGMQALERALAEGARATNGAANGRAPVRIVTSMDLFALIENAAQQVVEERSDGAKFARPEIDTDYVEPRDDVERTLVGYWEELLGVDRVGVEDSFFDLGGHSLIAVRLFAKIKKGYHVDLPISILFEAPTIARCAGLIKAQIGSATEQLARSDAQRTRYTHLVAMHPGEPAGKRPFFLVAGMFGNVLNLRHLAHLIGSDRPFYGLQARGLYGDHQPHETFEEMARDYLVEVRSVQPHGPYLLGGFSGGGITALEMAQQLHAAGEDVALLVFLDTPLPKAPPLSSVDKATIHLQRLVRGGPAYVTRWAQSRVRWELERFRERRDGAPVDESSSASFHSKTIEAAFRRSLDRYELAHYSGQVHLFRPKLDEAHRLPGNRVASSARELIWPDNGWTAHVDRLQVFEVPGNHDSMVLEPNVRVIAARLKRCIAKVEEELGQTAPSLA
jgi:acyl transferase domain-containing protein/thioesterase domain-containing protein